MLAIFSKWWGYAAATTAVLVLAIIGGVSVSSQDEEPRGLSKRLELLKKPEQTLSVDETLGVVFNPALGVSPRKYYARADPDAEAALYRVLDNDKLKEFHRHAWEILGYIGGEAQVQRVDASIEAFKSIPRMLTPAERDRLQALFNSLGVTCGREIDPACDVAEKMMDPAYWRDAQFRLDAKPLSIEYKCVSRLMIGYSLSLDPEIEKHTQSILKKVDAPKKREIWKNALNPELLLGHGWNTRSEEEEPVTREERREMASFFNGDLQNPGPARPPRAIAPDPSADDQGEEEGVPSPESDLDQLKRIPHKVYLNADGYIKYLNLRGEDITDETLGLLRQAPQLQSLALQHGAVTDKGLESLSRYTPQLRALSLTNTAVTDAGLRHLKELKKLDDLAISQSRKISDQGMKYVGRLNGLTELRLWELPNLTNEGLKDLRSLENLQILRLNKLPITDAALEHLASLRNLRKLYIHRIPMHGLGLKHLANHLTLLSLRGTPLVDRGLMHLQDMDRLEMLVLGGFGAEGYTMRVTDAAVQKLQEALPETEIRY